jgi:hypothetical protein
MNVNGCIHNGQKVDVFNYRTIHEERKRKEKTNADIEGDVGRVH